VKKILGTAEDYRVLYGQRGARAVIDRDDADASPAKPTVTKASPAKSKKKAAPARKAPAKKKKPARKH
jgi:hypothetical protein